MKINFFSEDVDFVLKKKEEIRKWINETVSEENKKIKEISFIFCSDNYLLEINREYLQHDYYTDIITFDNSESKSTIESDIFISIDRVKENAEKLEISFFYELKRVIIHGILHLCGYGDKTKEEESRIRAKEDYYLKNIPH